MPVNRSGGAQASDGQGGARCAEAAVETPGHSKLSPRELLSPGELAASQALSPKEGGKVKLTPLR